MKCRQCNSFVMLDEARLVVPHPRAIVIGKTEPCPGGGAVADRAVPAPMDGATLLRGTERRPYTVVRVHSNCRRLWATQDVVVFLKPDPTKPPVPSFHQSPGAIAEEFHYRLGEWWALTAPGWQLHLGYREMTLDNTMVG